MPHHRLVFVVIALWFAVPVAAQKTPDLAQYLMADRAAEIALARSAGPKSVGDSATILVLTKTGYVEAARGTNGFTCLMTRSFHSPFNDPKFWNPTNRGPQCLNPPAVRTVLPEMLKRAEWVMAGATKDELAKKVKAAYASHAFPMPAPGTMAYMLSPEQHLGSDDSHWVPHVMFWYDKKQPGAAWGLGDANNTLIDGTATDPDSPVLLVLIPVRRWSDGKLAMPEGGH